MIMQNNVERCSFKMYIIQLIYLHLYFICSQIEVTLLIALIVILAGKENTWNETSWRPGIGTVWKPTNLNKGNGNGSGTLHNKCILTRKELNVTVHKYNTNSVYIM